MARETAAVNEALAQHSVSPTPVEGIPPPGPGLFIVDRVSEAVLNRVTAFSHGGDGCVVAVLLGEASRAEMWGLLEAGAADVVPWSDADAAGAAIAARLARRKEVDALIEAPLVRATIIGRSHAWMRVLRRAVEAARFSDASILITGESGTGKELVARLVHALDGREDKQRLVVLDCTTVVPELSGSEFFGHEKGAYTNAVAARDGAFAQADRGTLFLDEIGDLAMPLQAELLRVVQERTYKRVGSNTWRRTDFRLVCATHRDLRRGVEAGTFRHDLYHRLANVTIELPPLRERREDILPLAYHFLREAYAEGAPPLLSPAVSDYLLSREYPGNVRELRHLVRCLAWRHPGPGPITPGAIPREERPCSDAGATAWQAGGFEQAIRQALGMGVGLKEISKEAADAAVRVALEEAGGSMKQAAARLGVTTRALQMRRAQKTSDG